MRILAGLVGLLVATAPLAQAAPPGETPPLQAIEYPRRQKSESTATLLTVAGIATPFALAYLAYEPDTDAPVWAPLFFVTAIPMPALGHWYAGKVGTYGMLMRLGAMTTIAVGFGYLDDAKRCARGEMVEDGCHSSDRATGRASLALGIAAWVGSWGYDVWSARREVRRFNRRPPITIMPMLTASTTGLALGGNF